MAKLTAAKRDKLPQLHAGHIGDEVAAKVRNKAHHVLKGD